ncbi:MAG TPA: ester cyclase [Gaiellales bacterium]|nr:ester cyclase [Gaiellales bacterium]
MQAAESKRIVRRFIDEYQTGASDAAFAELLHPDVIDHSRPPGIAPGAQGVRQQFDGVRAGLPDFRATILHQVAEGDLVMTHKVFHGTHTGELLGIPPTGREVEILVIDVVRVADGRIVEHWGIVDRLGLLQQLGAIPEPEAATA